MQPNQQNPYQQPAAPPSPTGYAGSNVPDFLQLDPLPEPKAPRSKKKMVAVVLSILILLGLAGGSVGYWQWQQGEPERQFYATLDSMLQVNHVARVYTVSLNGDELMSGTAKTDLSKPSQPRSHISYETIYADDELTEKAQKLKGEVVVSDSKDFYTRFDAIPDANDAGQVVLHQWYKASIGDNKFVSEVINPNEAINTTFGNVVTGNYDNEKRAQLMEYMKSQRPYRVLERHNEDIDNRPTRAYIVEVDSQKLGKLNKEVAEMLGVAVPFPFNFTSTNDPKKMKMTMWIDNNTGRLVKVIEQYKDTETQNVRVSTVNYSYPDSVTITLPEDAR